MVTKQYINRIRDSVALKFGLSQDEKELVLTKNPQQYLQSLNLILRDIVSVDFSSEAECALSLA